MPQPTSQLFDVKQIELDIRLGTEMSAVFADALIFALTTHQIVTFKFNDKRFVINPTECCRICFNRSVVDPSQP